MVTETDRPTNNPREHASVLLARTRWSPEQLAAHQRSLLDDLLRHAVASSPYYRRAFGPDPVGAELAELPTLSKQTLMAQFDDIVTEPALGLAAVQSHLAGPTAGEALHDHLVFSTSGSTGEPAVFVDTRAGFAQWVGALLRTLILVGVGPHLRIAGLGSSSGMHISRHLVAGLLGDRPSAAPSTSAALPLPQIVAAYNAYRPEVLVGYPSMHALLAHEQLAGRLEIAPSIIAYAGEVLTPDMRSRIHEAWGVDPVGMYSTTEAAMIASGCPAGVGMHLWEDLALVEVVDEHDRPVPPGVPGHRVLLTNLVNRVQPLIRYAISDLVTLADGPNPTGMPFRRLGDIAGRNDDIVYLPGRRGGTVAVPPTRLRAPLATIPALRQYQIRCGARGMQVRIALREHVAEDVPARVRTCLRDALTTAGAVPPPITVTVVAEVPRETGPGAKLKTVLVEHDEPATLT
jgi:phenylacetate-coenzyme A ligase PaaK-like adenylate-forming protein